MPDSRRRNPKRDDQVSIEHLKTEVVSAATKRGPVGRIQRVCDDGLMPFAPYPDPAVDRALESVVAALDPILVPLGFAPGQPGQSGSSGQVVFCGGLEHSTDGGCVDLVVDLEADPDWHVIAVRYWGYPAHRWHLSLATSVNLPEQLVALAHTLPDELP